MSSIEFLWLGWVVGEVGWGGFYSHFHVQHNYSVDYVLCCVVVGVVTTFVLTGVFLGKGLKVPGGFLVPYFSIC